MSECLQMVVALSSEVCQGNCWPGISICDCLPILIHHDASSQVTHCKHIACISYRCRSVQKCSEESIFRQVTHHMCLHGNCIKSYSSSVVSYFVRRTLSGEGLPDRHSRSISGGRGQPGCACACPPAVGWLWPCGRQQLVLAGRAGWEASLSPPLFVFALHRLYQLRCVGVEEQMGGSSAWRGQPLLAS